MALELVQLRVGPVDTPEELFDGEGLDGVPGAMQAVVKLQIGPGVVSPQSFFATIFQ